MRRFLLQTNILNRLVGRTGVQPANEEVRIGMDYRAATIVVNRNICRV